MSDNPLVAYTQPQQYIPLGNEVVAIAGAWGDGQLGINDFTSVGSMALNGLGIFLDPVNWVVGAILGPLIDWILSALPPCKKAMDFLTGSPEMVEEWALSFQQASTSVAAAATAAANSANSTLASWTGPGREAYRQAQREAVELQRSIADRQHTIYQFAHAIGGLVAMVKEFVVGLIKELVVDLVTKGVIAAAAAVPSLGSAIAAYTAWAAGKYALVMGKVARWFQKLFTKAADLVKGVGPLQALFTKIADMFGKLASKFDDMKAAADAAGQKVEEARAHQGRAEQRTANAEEMRSQGNDRTTRRAAEREDGKAADQYNKMTRDNRDANDIVGNQNAGPSTVTKTAVDKGGQAATDHQQQHPTQENPADAIPEVN